MAIFHLSVKAVSRSEGRTATAAAAYRSGALITDGRTGEVHDYRRKRGIVHAEMVLPADPAFAWAADRAALWNAAEAAERRKDACVAREYEVALPAELSDEQRRRLVLQFAQAMADEEGFAVDVAIHRPGRDGDSRNHHAHILRTTRKVAEDGTLSVKLDTEKAGRKRRADLDAVRTSWAALCNEHLREAGIDSQVDHRSLKDQGVDRVPTSHLGPAVTALELRGQRTEVTRRIEEEVTERLQQARKAGELERAVGRLDQIVIDLSGDLEAAKAERGRIIEKQQITTGVQAHGNGRNRAGDVWAFGRYERDAQAYELDAFQHQGIGQAESLDSLRDLSSIDVVPGLSRGEVLLSSDATSKLEDRKPDRTETLRRDFAGKRRLIQEIAIDLSGDVEAARSYAREAGKQFKAELQAEAQRKELTRSFLLDQVQPQLDQEPDQEQPGFGPSP